MPLNIYDELKQKCQLEIRPCADVNINGYNKQSIECIGKTVVQCQHGNVTKNAKFYVTSITDSKVILGLRFCKAFGLVSVNCDENCQCKQISLDIINSEFP